MENFFVDIKSKEEIDYSKIVDDINKISEKNIAICYSNQFENIAKKISKMTNKNVSSLIQTLGCSNPKFSKEVEAIIFVGEGKFHSVSIAYESKLPTYFIENNKFSKILDEDIKKMENRKNGALLKYLKSKKVGILVSLKPGQQKLKQAIEFKNNLKNKKAYLFLANEININEFENYEIDSWVNTACPRLDLDSTSIINLNKIPSNFR